MCLCTYTYNSTCAYLYFPFFFLFLFIYLFLSFLYENRFLIWGISDKVLTLMSRGHRIAVNAVIAKFISVQKPISNNIPIQYASA